MFYYFSALKLYNNPAYILKHKLIKIMCILCTLIPSIIVFKD